MCTIHFILKKLIHMWKSSSGLSPSLISGFVQFDVLAESGWVGGCHLVQKLKHLKLATDKTLLK
jgi:hypothetical protein